MTMTMTSTARLYRLTAGLLGLTGLVLSFLFGPVSQHPVLSERIVRFFSFFTVMTNLLAALAMVAPALAPNSRAGRMFLEPRLRSAITGFILVVGLLYHLLLREDLRSRRGLSLLASILCHYVVPTLFLLDWTVLVRRGAMAWRTSLWGLAYPLSYLLWVMVYGGASDWYPYPFLDAGRRGYGTVTGNAVRIAATFLGIALLLTTVDRLAARWRDRRQG